MHLDALEHRSQSSLSSPVTPYLRHDGLGGVQRLTGPLRSGQENSGTFLVAIDGYEHSGVKDQRPNPKRSMASMTAASSTGPFSPAHSSRAR